MPEASSSIKFDQYGLGGVLKQFQLEVPPNQREYAWKDEHVNQLFDDFAEAINDGVDYFVGTIVTIPRASTVLEVVDGQQRLATTAILLAAVRDYLSDKNEAVLVESINNDFLTGIDRARRMRIPKLRLNVEDNELFGQIVDADAQPTPQPQHESHARLVNAYRLARRRVHSIVSVADEESHGDFLNTWVTFLEQRALVVLLRVADDADAFRMFETLNDRGLRTSQADLVKNYLFGRAGTRFTEVQTRWAFMRGTLESLDEEDITINFLRHALIALSGYLTAAKVYEEVRTQARSETSTVSFMSNLESMATAYVATLNPEHERWNNYPEAVRRAIEALNLFNIKPLRALLLAVGARMNPNETGQAFSFIVSLGVRLMIASSTRSGSVEVPIATAAHAVYAHEVTTAAELKDTLRAVTPTDDTFEDAVKVARVSNARLARYYLRSMEMAIGEEPEPWFIPQDDRAVITLEHVLPRKPESNWPGFDVETHARNVNRLGNLVLMRASDNSDSKSAAFGLKRPIYSASPYALTCEVGAYDEWTPDTIEARQERLAELAVKTWPIR